MLPRVFAALSALHQCTSERQSKRQGYLRTLRSGVRMVRGAVWRPTAMTTAGGAPNPLVSVPPSAARLLRENAARLPHAFKAENIFWLMSV